MKRLHSFIVCLLSITLFLSACSAGSSAGVHTSIQLTAEQQARIDVIVENREEWKETMEYITAYTVNRVHISEVSSGHTVLTVAHEKKGLGTGWKNFVGVKGYAVDDGKLVSIDGHHKDWAATCLPVDVEIMSDQELKEVLQQSYLSFLNNTKH